MGEDWHFLLEAGSDTEVKSHKGQTVLFSWADQSFHWTSEPNKAKKFISLLLRYGANPSATDEAGNTLLHCKQRSINLKAVELLAKASVNINSARRSDLVTPLIAAAQGQFVDSIRLFVDNGARPNLQDHLGNTALHYICSSWLAKMSHIKEWLSFCDPSIKNNKGETAIYNLHCRRDSHQYKADLILMWIERCWLYSV
jgi:ankyrin repeat protein